MSTKEKREKRGEGGVRMASFSSLFSRQCPLFLLTLCCSPYCSPQKIAQNRLLGTITHASFIRSTVLSPLAAAVPSPDRGLDLPKQPSRCLFVPESLEGVVGSCGLMHSLVGASLALRSHHGVRLPPKWPTPPCPTWQYCLPPVQHGISPHATGRADTAVDDVVPLIDLP